MFGFSFGEILLIAIVAIVFLGPDKLPQAIIQVAKFLKTLRKTMEDAKESLNKELRIEELKKEALEYKEKLDEQSKKLKEEVDKNIDNVKKSTIDTWQDHTTNIESMFKDYKPKETNIHSLESNENIENAQINHNANEYQSQNTNAQNANNNIQETINSQKVFDSLNEEVQYDDFNAPDSNNIQKENEENTIADSTPKNETLESKIDLVTNSHSNSNLQSKNAINI